MTRELLAVMVCVGGLAACAAESGDQGVSKQGSPAQGASGKAAVGGNTAVAAGAASKAGSGASTPVSTTTAGTPAAEGGRGAAGQSATPPQGGRTGRGFGQGGQPAPAGSATMPPIGPLGGPDAAGVQIANPEPKLSAGCGKPPPMAGNATIDVMGTSREYILYLPSNYDANKAYKLIYAWHGLGGTAQQIAASWYGLKNMSQNGAIFVAGQGLPTSSGSGGAGWPNSNGQDVNFVKALHALLQSELCFDENRVFSVGMSYGGIMSHTLGCSMGDVFRAIAPMSGSGPGFGGRATCVGQVGVWMSHGDNDTTVSTMSGEASRDFWVKTNHCMPTGQMVEPSPCVEYPGCDADYPVTFCEFAGGHTIPPFASSSIWKFFSQF